MAKIIGNTTAMPNPRPDWTQTDKAKADYIKNKPFGTEVTIAPVNELSMVDGDSILGGQLYQFDHSLCMVADTTYNVKAYAGDVIATSLSISVFDATSLTSQADPGVLAMCIMDSDGEVDNVVGFDNAIYDVDSDRAIYSNKHCVVMNIGSAITKIIIEGLEGTYEKVVYNKLPKEYLDVAVDQKFNAQSTNAQSGVAVEQAIDAVTEKFPSSVVAQLSAPTTLGDQHIKVSTTQTNTGTKPFSTSLNIYTEGIGLNSDLKTTNTDTLVNAINEIHDEVDNNKSNIETALNIHSNQTSNIVADTISGDNLFVDYNPITERNNILLLTPNDISDDVLPNTCNIHLPEATLDNIVVGNTIDGFVWFDFLTYKLHELRDGVHSVIVDIYNTPILKQYQTMIDSFYNTYGKQCHLIYNSTDNQAYLIGRANNDASDIVKLNISKGKNYISQTSMSYDFADYKIDWSRPGIGSIQCYQSSAVNQLLFNPIILDSVIDSTKPGKLLFVASNDAIVTFGEDNWINAQSITNGARLSLSRAIDENGVEYVQVNSWAKSTVYTGIDNNEHSAYLYIGQYDDYKYTSICLSSSGEILYRNMEDGTIIKRIAVNTDTDLFSKNLQYCSLQLYGNCLYAFNEGYVYKISNLDKDVVVQTMKFDNAESVYRYSDMRIVKNCIMGYNHFYNQYSLESTSKYKKNYLTGILLKQISDLSQPDWSQNNPTTSTYIQNRPFYSEEVSTNYITLPYSNINAALGVGTYGKTLGLVLGSTYTVDIITESGTTTSNLVAIEISDSSTGISGVVGLTDADGFVLYNGMIVDADGNFVAGDGVLYEMSDTTIKALIHGFDGTETVYHKIPLEYIDQGDWNENNPESLAYIKNRTHWKAEEEVDYLPLPYVEPIPGLGLGAYGKRIGLQSNTSYDIEIELDGQIAVVTATTSEMPKELLGVVIPGVVYLYQRDLELTILDGIEGNFATSTITGTDNCYYTFADALPQVKIHGVKGRDTIIHKVPNEYLDFEQINTNIKISEEHIEDQSVTNDKIADGSITGVKLKTPYNLYNLDITEEVSRIQQDFNQNYNKIMVRGQLELKGTLDNFIIHLGTKHNAREFVITDNPNQVNVCEFVGEITSLGSMLRIDFCYHFGDNGWQYGTKNHFVTEYISWSNLDNVSITLSGVTTNQGNVMIDCVL